MRMVRSLTIIMFVVSVNVLAKPAEPIITEWEIPKLVPLGSDISIQWNTWSGEKAERWVLLENGYSVESGFLNSKETQNSYKTGVQQGLIEFSPHTSGTHEYRVMLCNGEGCSPSKNALRISVIDSQSAKPFPEKRRLQSRELLRDTRQLR